MIAPLTGAREGGCGFLFWNAEKRAVIEANQDFTQRDRKHHVRLKRLVG